MVGGQHGHNGGGRTRAYDRRAERDRRQVSRPTGSAMMFCLGSLGSCWQLAAPGRRW